MYPKRDWLDYSGITGYRRSLVLSHRPGRKDPACLPTGRIAKQFLLHRTRATMRFGPVSSHHQYTRWSGNTDLPFRDKRHVAISPPPPNSLRHSWLGVWAAKEKGQYVKRNRLRPGGSSLDRLLKRVPDVAGCGMKAHKITDKSRETELATELLASGIRPRTHMQ